MSTQRTAATDVDAVVLAFMIADIRGYSRFSRAHGDGAAATLAKRFADLARDGVEARGGSVIELRGDEVFATFPTAPQAVQAAVDLQLSCIEESEHDSSLPLLIGIGIDIGPGVPVEDGYRGNAINLAARLCSSAGAGQVLLTAIAAEQAESISGDVELNSRGTSMFKGFDEPVDVVEARARSNPVPVDKSPIGGEPLPPELVDATPLVGRTHEMRWLRGTWRQVRRGRGRVVAIDGPAGIGKTRLAAEIASHVLSFGGVTRYAGPGGLAAATALSAVSYARSAQAPSLIVIDQLDVVGPDVIDAIEDAVADVAGLPVLLLLLLRDIAVSPATATLVERCATMSGHRRLTPLSPAEVADIVALYAGDSAGEAPVEMIVRASRGVPALVHEQASEWARSETTRRLEAAAEFMAAARERRTTDLEFANNVIGLKLGRLYAPGSTPLPPGIEELGPYKGLASFDQEDVAWFFGREQVVGELAARIVASGALAILGASGSGKSSVVAAGLLPSLRAGLLPGSGRWSHAEMRPSEQPIAALRAALASQDDDPIAAAIERLEDGGRLVLVIDQFEEVFAACDSETERTEFLELLAMHAARDAGQFAVVVTLRSDFYGHLASYPALAGLLADNHVLVGPLTRAELHRVVQLPAQRAGVRIESALIEALVDEAAGEPGALPLLSTALVELWQTRSGGWIRADAYHKSGGIRGAVARLAEASYAQLDEADQGAARRMLLRLASTAEGETDTRRRVELDEFDLGRDVAARRVLDRFTADRLLTVSGSTVEVAHEALLREWPRLRDWLDEDVHGRQMRQHLTLAANGWDTAGREPSEVYRGARLSAVLEWAGNRPADLNDLERAFVNASREASEAEAEKARRTNRRLRRIAIALAAVVVLAVAGGVIAVVERGSAQLQARRAQAAALTADARRLAALSANAPDTAAASQLALAAYRLDDTPDTQAALLAAVERTGGALWRIQYRERVFDVTATADGTRVALRDGRNVVVLDPRTRTPLTAFAARGAQVVGLSGDGGDVVTFQTNDVGAKDAGSLYAQAIPSGRLTGVLTRDGDPNDSAVRSYGGRWFALITTKHLGRGVVIQVFDSRDWHAPPREFVTAGHPAAMEASASALAVEHTDGSVEVRAFASLTRVGRLSAIAENLDPTLPHLLAVSPDGTQVARADPKNPSQVTIYDVRRPAQPSIPLPAVSVAGAGAIAFSPNGSELALGAVDGPLGVYRASDGSRLDSFAGNSGQLFQVAWAGASAPTALYSVGLDGELISWDLGTQPRLLHESGADYPGVHASLLTNVALDGSRHVTAFSESSSGPQPDLAIDLRNAAISRWPADLRSNDTCCIAMSASSDGRLVLESVPESGSSPNQGGPTRNDVWDVRTGKIIWTLTTPPSGLNQNVIGIISPDGTRAYVNLTTTRIGVYALPSGQHLRTFSVHFPGTNSSDGGAPWAVDPAGRLLIYLGQNNPDNRLGLAAPKAGRIVAQVQLGDIASVMGLAWSNDGRLLAVGTFTGTLFILDANTLAIREKLNAAEPGSVRSISFSPDDRTVVTTGDTGQLDFWTVAGLDREAHVTIGDGRVYAWYNAAGGLVGLAPDLTRPGADMSRWFNFGSDSASLVAEACTLAGSDLTRTQWQHEVGDQPYRNICP